MPVTEPWAVPRAWEGERCYVLCGGRSVRAQQVHVPRLRGRVIAVKESVLLRPDADVLFLGGERLSETGPALLSAYRGDCVVIRGRSWPGAPAWCHRIGRTETHGVLSTDPTAVCGFDSGTSALNLAVLFGATEIVMLGYDMCGGRWFDHPHPLPEIPQAHFDRHLEPLEALAQDCRRQGIRVVNVSPTSVVPGFERASVEAFLS